MSEKQLTCAVAINLGATKTGVCTFLGSPDHPMTKHDVHSAVIVTPKDGDGITFSSASRTAKRHEIRNRTRFALARRLMNAIVVHLLDIGHQDLKPQAVESIQNAMATLLRRRGFTYSETDLSIFDALDATVFQAHPVLNELVDAMGEHPYFGQFFGVAKEDVEGMDFDKIEEILGRDDFPTKRTFKAFLKEQANEFPDIDITQYVEAFTALTDEAVATSSVRSRGRKSRRTYQNAVTDIVKDELKFRPLLVALNGDASQLSNILLHISNLELRALRHYFEDPRVLLSKSEFDAEALRAVLIRAYKRFAGGISHLNENNPSAFLVRTLRECTPENLLGALAVLNPALTIPPFERLTNRGTTIDQTLFLAPELLTLHFPKWTSWALKIAQANPELEEDLDEILGHIDRNSRRLAQIENGPKTMTSDQLRLSYVLHRALDRSKAIDPYALRSCVANPHGEVNKKPMARLAATLGAQNVDEFLDFARDYYKETEQVRQGMFLAEKTRFFERADIHPPRIQKILPFLIADILRCDTQVAQDFIDRVWTLPVGGRRTVKSACKYIEEARKEDGLIFNREYKAALTREYRKLPKEEGDKTYLTVAKLVEATSETIANALGQDEDVCAKYANPFSLAQLYNLLEVERMGFSSISVAARLENAWRNRMVATTVKGKDVTCANASRLTADVVRPFDGVLAKVLDRQAYEVSRLIYTTLRDVDIERGAEIYLPLLVEQNRFSFDLSLAELKKLKNDRAEKGLKRIETRWQQKDDRIRAANKLDDTTYLCPFTGKKFTKGQFATILSAKNTRGEGRNYDVEPNLIYCSLEGHRDAVGLEALHPNYLKHVFGTDNIHDIEVRIEETVAKLVEENRLSPFFQLSIEEQTMVRHALFLRSSVANREVRTSLRNQYKTATNGTQAWFVRRLIEKLKDQLQPIWSRKQVSFKYDVQTIDPEMTYRIRGTLAKFNPTLAKDASSSVMSSVIDAACVGAAGWSAIRNGIDATKSLRNIAVLNEMLPADCEVIRIESKKPGAYVGRNGNQVDPFSKPVFKSTIYGEDFLPLFSTRGKLYVGYRSMIEGAIEVTGKAREDVLRLLLPFFKQKAISPLDDAANYTIDKKKAFEHLKFVAHNLTDEDVKYKQAKLLESLHYYFIRPGLNTVLLNKAGDKMKTYDELVDEVISGTTVKLDLKSAERGIFKATGRVALPVRHEWMKLIAHKDIAPFYGESFSTDRLDHVMPKLRLNTPIERHNHHANRWSVSLPMVTSPSGTPVRIERKNYRGQTLYQTQTVSTSAAGFPIKKGKVDWDTPVLAEHLTRRAFTVFGNRKEPNRQVISMDEWRLVASEPIKIWMSPGTADRRKIRVEAPFDLLKPWINALNPNLAFESGSALPAYLAYKAGGEDITAIAYNLFGEKIAKLMDKPKSRIVLSRVGETIVLAYTPSASTKAMKEAFDSAS